MQRLTMIYVVNIILLNGDRVLTSDVETPKNILFILIDDLRHLSDKKVYLPNINFLGKTGATFNNAFAQQALCAPSRNSLLTGRRPDSLRLYDFYSYWRDRSNGQGNFTTIPQFFKEHGYDTYSVGKVFHPGKSSNFTDDYPYSWSEYPYHPPTEMYKDAKVCRNKKTKKLERNLICPVSVKRQPGQSLPDLQSLDYAIDFLKKRNGSKPFFLAIGFHKPHIPLKFPKEYLKQMPISKVHRPKEPNIPKDMPLVSWHPWTDVRKRDDIRRLNITFPFGVMPTKWTLKIRQSYYAAALYIDELIGILLSYVDMQKTIIVLTSDHGWSLGENGLWAKYSNFDYALKVPLIFKSPKLIPTVVHEPVELIDIFPTLVDLTKLSDEIPKCLNHKDTSQLCFEGKSLVPFIENNSNGLEAFAISQCPRPSVYPQKNSDKPRLKDITIMGYSIRTKRYRYTEWISFNNTLFTKNWNNNYGIELYDHIIDPIESKNLFLVSKYKNIAKVLSIRLRSSVYVIV
ncbi:iduronate 2-sulfatase [Bombyx mori]|uniref:Sulfatase N-terminal domain-containing protein n=1 Tax=Bombyx mori TaxID=7091 RepID=A0A8R2DKX8_BOMMO|nr:iduronate 2-sulfatase [Bombyx mori]